MAAAERAGLFGPESVAWRIDREAIVLAGGTCALLMQLAHPAVAAGVAQHSTFREDPFARLRRTLTATYAVVFGSRSRAERALDRINAIHDRVRGTIPETGAPYGADDPDALLWVHATLIDTALRVYDGFVRRLPAAEAEDYHRESRLIATRLGVPEERVPVTLRELRTWMERVMVDGTIEVTSTARSLAPSVLYPTRVPPRFVWDAAHLVSVAVMPEALRRGYGIPWNRRRAGAMRRVAAVSRRILPLLPAALRDVPHARSAERRIAAGRVARRRRD